MTTRRPIALRPLPAALAAAAAAALAGCGIADPYAQRAAQPTPTTQHAAPVLTSADPAPERGGVIPSSAQPKSATGSATPQAAILRFARIYMNWTARSVASAQRQLAAMSVGGARAQALQAAASYQRDSTLLASHVANSGTVVAIAQGAGPAAGQWVIVTEERTAGTGDYAGLPAAINVTYATVKRAAGGWLIAEWSPQR